MGGGKNILPIIKNVLFSHRFNSKIMKRLLFSLLTLLCSIVVYAQGVNGCVVNSGGVPVSDASVVLQHTDSTFVNVTITDSDGLFSFAEELDSFRLVVQHMAYHPCEVLISGTAVGDIVLNESDVALEEVVVSAVRPLVKVEDGKLAYDLGQLTKDKVATNTYEALTKLPGVSEKEEKLSLIGAGSLTVIINGHPSTMTEEQVYALLKSTPIERVEKAEVMYSAPPQYHVRGAAINIVLKKDTQYSLQGELGAVYRNRFGDTGGAHAFLRVATPRQAFDIMYSATLVEEVQDLDMVSLHTLAGVVHDIRQKQRIRGDVWLHNARASYDYNFNDKNSMTLAYNRLYKSNGSSATISKGNFQNSRNDKDVDRDDMHNFSIQAHTGIGLSAGADYTMYENRSTRSMSVDFVSGGTASMEQKAGQKIRSFHAFADQSHSLGNGWTLGYGASYRNSESEDFQLFSAESTMNGGDVNSSLSEHTAEAYVSFGKQSMAGLSFSLSATAEFYKVNDSERWTIYPQGSVTYMRNPNHIFQGTLQVTKLYPSYWQMQAAVGYLDGYSEMHNTPGLEPSKMYNLNANYIFKQKYVFGAYCNYIDKMFGQTMYQATDRLALIYKTINWDYMLQSGVFVTAPYSPVSWFSTQATLVGGYMSQRCDNFFDIGFKDNGWFGFFHLDNSFRVNKNLVFELNGFVQSPVTQGTFSVETMWQVSAGAKWNFAGGKGTLSCFYNDIFNSTLSKMKMDFKGQHVEQGNNMYTRNFTLSLTYRFGGYKKKETKEVDTSRFGH